MSALCQLHEIRLPLSDAGFGIQVEAQTHQVTEVSPSGAAHSAGMQVYDVIMAVESMVVTGEQLDNQLRARHASYPHVAPSYVYARRKLGYGPRGGHSLLRPTILNLARVRGDGKGVAARGDGSQLQGAAPDRAECAGLRALDRQRAFRDAASRRGGGAEEGKQARALLALPAATPR